jgi:hypothetical protein
LLKLIPLQRHMKNLNLARLHSYLLFEQLGLDM